METTFELSLLARIFQHKTAILGAYIVENYVKEQCTGSINIPEFQAKEQIADKVPSMIHEYLEKGIFEAKYAEAYEAIKDRIPDNYSVCM